MKTRGIFRGFGPLLLIIAVANAQADPADPLLIQSARVRVDTTEWNSPQGRERLRRHLADAAGQLCRRSYASSRVDYRQAVADCIDEAVEDGLRQAMGETRGIDSAVTPLP
ncbi:MAG TPA: UrcA family protein [Burkholderiaceae bacterium]|nr:UrcA family protein [Burkholderiaceae bacterium]